MTTLDFLAFSIGLVIFLAIIHLAMSRGKFEPKGFLLMMALGLVLGLPVAYVTFFPGRLNLLAYFLVVPPLSLFFIVGELITLLKGRGPRIRSVCGIVGISSMVLVPVFPERLVLVPIIIGFAGIGIFLTYHFRYRALNPMWLHSIVVEAAKDLPKGCPFSPKPITVVIPSKKAFQSGVFGCSVYVRKDRTTVWLKKKLHKKLGEPNLELFARNVAELIQRGGKLPHAPSKNILLACSFLFLLAPRLPVSADEYSFERVFPSFESSEAAGEALKTTMDGETELRLGNYYFIQGTSPGTSPSQKKEFTQKAVEILEGAWKRNKKDNEVCLSLAYAYTGRAGITPMSELEALLSDINKAQNLFGMIVARLPRNIDARLGRTMINMNLTARNGRPDALILEDYLVFMEGFARLRPELKANQYYVMGAMEMRLAKAMVLKDQGKKAEAKSLVAEIDASVLPEQFRKLHDALRKELKY